MQDVFESHSVHETLLKTLIAQARDQAEQQIRVARRSVFDFVEQPSAIRPSASVLAFRQRRPTRCDDGPSLELPPAGIRPAQSELSTQAFLSLYGIQVEAPQVRSIRPAPRPCLTRAQVFASLA